VSGGPLENGGTFEDCETLKNTGNISGTDVVVGLTNVQDFENGYPEPEEGPAGSGAGSGELSKYLMIKGTLTCGGTEYDCTPNPSQASTNGYVRLNDASGHSISVHDEIAPGDTCELCFTVKLIEDGNEENANDAMTDQTQFDIDLALEQNPS